MNITFLGTSAANAFPEAFCSCENCKSARSLGGPSLRKRSAALINDDLLIDLGPDIMTAAFTHDCSLTNVRYCLQTHFHADHLDTSHFLSRSPGFGVVGSPRLHFYASASTIELIAQRLERYCAPHGFFDPQTKDLLNLEIHRIKALNPFTFDRYKITAFPANHDSAVEPLLYAVEVDGRTIFYGTDTASLPDETWQGFHRSQLCFDIVILDHTYGPEQSGTDHLSAQDFIAHVDRMRYEGLLAEDARVFATHISHEGNPAHPDLEAFAARHDYEIAYNGLTI